MMKQLSLLLLLIFNISATFSRGDKPNFLFLFADDHSHKAVGFAGNSVVQTPHIDQLAREGICFTNAYNMGGWHGAICVASRTMLNTGRSIWRSMRAEPLLDSLAAAGQFWSQVLAANGYETYFTGKWHVQVDPEKLFHHVRHVRPGMPRTVPESYNRPLEGQPDPWSPSDTSPGGYWEGGRHWSEVVADDAVGFLQEASSAEQPFFMYIAFNAPHDPRQSPREYLNMYQADEMPLPESFLPEYPYKDPMGCPPGLRDEQLAPFPRTPFAVKTHMAEYYAIITHMDRQVGRIIRELERLGLSDNTYIIYSADQGLACGEHGLMGKQNMYDHSMKPPLVIAGPGIESGTSCDRLVYLQDIVPTTLELSGTQIPGYVEFKSLRPYITGDGQADGYPYIYGCYQDLQRMIRDERYKLVAYPRAGAVRLYDMQTDPFELHDISGLDQNSPRIQKMLKDMERAGKTFGDTVAIGDCCGETVGRR